MLSEGLSKTSDHPQRSGGFADVWLGKLGERPVAIKALRIYAKDDMKRVKKVSSDQLQRIYAEELLEVLQ